MKSKIPKKPICPECKNPATMTMTSYGARADCVDCGMRSWGYKPMTDYATLTARTEAHNVFDKIWGQYKLCSRTRAYKLLAEAMGMKPTDCHISLMNENEARQVPVHAKIIMDDLSRNKPLFNALAQHPLANAS